MSRHFFVLLAAGLLTGAVAAFTGAQPPIASDADAIELAILGSPDATIRHATFSALQRIRVPAASHGEAPFSWSGVTLIDVLRLAHVPLDGQLKGRAMTWVVRITAADGYQLVFALTELDAPLGRATVILADQHESKPLPSDDGPFRLVVAGDRRGTRWERNVRRIELIDAGTLANPVQH